MTPARLALAACLALLLSAPAFAEAPPVPAAAPDPAPADGNPDAGDPDDEAACALVTRLDTIFQIADTYLEAERVGEAVKEYERILALEPARDAGPKCAAELLKGKCRACVSLVDLAHDRAADKEAALGYARRAIDLLGKIGAGDPDLLAMKVDMLRRAADLHRERKEFDRSIELLREAEALQAK